MKRKNMVVIGKYCYIISNESNVCENNEIFCIHETLIPVLFNEFLSS